MILELIKVALGKQFKLSHNPSQEEWKDIFLEAQKQSMVGIAFAGVQKLPKDQWPPQALLFKWIGTTEIIKQRNALLEKQCAKLQKRFAEAGIKTSILKGQGIARLYEAYPQPLPKGKGSEVPKGNGLGILRQPGDIDIYVDCGRVRLFEIVDSPEFRGERQSEDKNRKSLIRDWDYKHLHLDVFKDTEVEVHYRVEVLLSLWKNRKLQRWFKEHEELLFSQNGDLITPTIEFNRFYILLHIYRHFLYEGVGLRQLLDYYFVLKSLTPSPIPADAPTRSLSPKGEGSSLIGLTKLLRQFGMWKFARGVMWVLQEVFGLEKEYMIGEPLESEGRFILSEVMVGGNFGHHDERLLSEKGGKLQTLKKVIKHNAHLMRHYPAEIVWPPIWFVWHKCWKMWIQFKGLRV